MLSIIIPALNEEQYLPLLLASLKRQPFSNYEIILADGGSTDKTLEIAKNYGCTIIEGGLPAKARNSGAKVAKGDVLFFLDSDTVLPNDFLQKAFLEVNKRKLDVVSFCLIPYPKSVLSSFFLNFFYNGMIIITESFLPHGAMGIMIKKELFEKIGGFNEKITLAEDHDMVRRAAKQGKFGIVRSVHLVFSDRRFRKDGWIATGIKYFLCECHMIFIGPVTSNIVTYQFNHYKDKK